jgi:hypothetical protein
MAFKLHPKCSTLIPIILFALLAAHLADAAPQQTTPTPTTSSTSSSSTVLPPNCTPIPTCGFLGDSNTYGIGIRVGIYLQWITSGLAYNFVPEEAAEMRGVNFIFTLSNFAGKEKNHSNPVMLKLISFALRIRSSLYHPHTWSHSA